MADTRLEQLAKTDRNPIQEEEYQKLLKEQGQTSTGGVIDMAKQLYELANQFRAPAIKTLQQGYSNIGTAYGGLEQAAKAEVEPLNQRYNQLLQDVTSGTRQAAANEFTRRGIPLSSGLVEQTVGTRLAPQIAELGYNREAGLRDINALLANLGVQKMGATSALDQAIASIQAASAPESISGAMSMYQIQEQARQQAASQALQQLQYELAKQAQDWTQSQSATPNYITLSQGQGVYDPVTLQQLLYNPKTYAPGSTSSDSWE